MFSYKSGLQLGLPNQKSVILIFSMTSSDMEHSLSEMKNRRTPDFTFLIIFDWQSTVLGDTMSLEKHFCLCGP